MPLPFENVRVINVHHFVICFYSGIIGYQAGTHRYQTAEVMSIETRGDTQATRRAAG
jgi:hypothetical protein